MSFIHAKRRFGQNFLKSGAIIDKIVERLAPQSGERIIEIGPGKGDLTMAVAKSGADLLAIEIDRELIGHLERRFREKPNVQILQRDILTVDPEALNFGTFALVGNLPFNISAPVVEWIVQNRSHISRACLMFQKEVAHRLAAKPKSKDWSPLSIFTQLYFDITIAFDVLPKHFTPEPEVTATVVYLQPKPEVRVPHPTLFEHLVRGSFRQRRKLLLNNLVPDYISDLTVGRAIVNRLNLGPHCRAEELSTQQFIELTEMVASFSTGSDS